MKKRQLPRSIKRLPKYGDGIDLLTKNKAGNMEFGSDIGGNAGVSAGLSTAGTLLSMMPDKTVRDSQGNLIGTRPSAGESIGSEALKYAGMGAAFGPYGAAAGALVGGTIGLINSNKQKQELDKARAEAEGRRMIDEEAMGSKYQDFLSSDYQTNTKSFYAFGGYSDFANYPTTSLPLMVPPSQAKKRSLKHFQEGGTKPPQLRLPGIQTMPQSSTAVGPVVRNVLMDELVTAKTSEAKKAAEAKMAKKRVAKNPETWTMEDWKQYRVPEPGIQYVPVESALLPSSLPLKAASKLGKAAVFGAETLNPLGGFTNISKQLNKATKGTSSVLNEVKGELLQGKANRESIKQGNEWLENWIKHPATQEKISADIDAKIDFVNNPIEENNLLRLISTQSRDFKPNSKEYSLLKQLDNNLQQYLSKESDNPIHQGNWGTSYQHSVHPLNRYIIDEGIEKPFDRYGSWISRTTKLPQSKRVSTTIHEGTHDWVSEEAFKKSGMRNIALKNTNPKIKNDFLEWEKYRKNGIDPVEKMGKKRAYQAYLADPTEQHARIMELRYQLGLTPEHKVTPKYAKEVIDWIDQGGSQIDPQFLNVIDRDPNKLTELFNRFWAVPPTAIGAGVLQQKQEQPQYAYGGIKRSISQFVNGGYGEPNSEIEDNELVQIPGEYPMAMDGGQLEMANSNMFEADGQTHEEMNSNGTTGIETYLPQGSRVFSDRVKHNGRTIASIVSPISKKIGKLEERMEKMPSKALENTIGLLKNQEDFYFNKQEEIKQDKEAARTLRTFMKGGYKYC